MREMTCNGRWRNEGVEREREKKEKRVYTGCELFETDPRKRKLKRAMR